MSNSLYDVLGNAQLKIELPNSSNKVIARIIGMATGIYIYKYFKNGSQIKTGKLVIE